MKIDIARLQRDKDGYYWSMIRPMICWETRFVENEIKELCPEMCRDDRVRIAGEEPFLSAVKELRQLNSIERQLFETMCKSSVFGRRA